MPQAWRTIRVFISSTFRDIQAERDHLVRFVFPRLREELLQRRIHLVDVDLRWGVTSEQDALDVVREIIDECRPWFLCILGGRYGWVPPGQDCSVTESDIRYAVLDRPGSHGRPLFYFRDPEATNSIPEEVARAGGYTEADPANARKLADLKQAIRDAGFEPFEYHPQWDHASQRLAGLDDFGNRVYSDLLASIDDQYGVEAPEALDEFAEEDAAMEAFVEEHVQRYVVGSRRPLFRDLFAFTQRDGEPNVVVLTGRSGCGKSALLGQFSQDYAREHPEDLVITHFFGASAGSTDLRRTLRRLCHAVARAAGDERELPQEAKELATRFEELLGQAAQRQRVVLILDALNQLDAPDNAHTMFWLPRSLPPNARVVVSSIEHPALGAIRGRGELLREIALEPLSSADSRQLVEAFLVRYQKKMDEMQIAALLGKPESGNPLYLFAALEELRTLGTYEEITARIRELPGEAQPLFLWILKRLEQDPGFRDPEGHEIGAELVRQFVSCLGVSRHGLSQVELAELIAPGDPHASPPISADAQGNVGAVIRMLRPHLARRGELLDFRERLLRQAVEGEYLDDADERLTAHRQLAQYFHGKAMPVKSARWTFPAVGPSHAEARALRYLPYHACEGHMLDLWLEVMTDFGYLRAVVEYVEVGSGTEADGTEFEWHEGYFVIRDEVERWLAEPTSTPEAETLIRPLQQVWERHEVDFVVSAAPVMGVLYCELTELEPAKPRRVADRATRRFVLQGGVLWTWCERERAKYEEPSSPWHQFQTGGVGTRRDDAAVVFISAKSMDYEYGLQVHNFLTTRGVRTFFSQESLPQLGDSDYRKAIDRALDQAQHMVVVASSADNAQSPWVEAEWGFFINEKRSGRKTGNLITLTVGALRAPQLPPSLRYYEVIPLGPGALEKVLRYVSR